MKEEKDNDETVESDRGTQGVISMGQTTRRLNLLQEVLFCWATDWTCLGMRMMMMMATLWIPHQVSIFTLLSHLLLFPPTDCEWMRNQFRNCKKMKGLQEMLHSWIWSTKLYLLLCRATLSTYLTIRRERPHVGVCVAKICFRDFGFVGCATLYWITPKSFVSHLSKSKNRCTTHHPREEMLLLLLLMSRPSRVEKVGAGPKGWIGTRLRMSTLNKFADLSVWTCSHIICKWVCGWGAYATTSKANIPVQVSCSPS